MINRKRTGLIAAVLAAAVLCTAAALFAADNFSVAPAGTVPTPEVTTAPLMQGDFNGTIRVYIVEPTSRWKDANHQSYHFGFIDFALDSAISLNNGERIHLSRIWDASTSGFGGFSETNIMAIAVLEQQDSVRAYAYPPSSNPFYAHMQDGAAYAEPGQCDSNNTSATSTHTVFIEEATATWCGYCPNVNYYLYNVYSTGNYNFIYTALVNDVNGRAAQRIGHFNLYGFPTTFADGGDGVLLGGQSPNTPYVNLINACGARTVSGANVMIKVGWLGGGDLQIDLAYALGTALNTPTEPAAAPTGDPKPMLNTATDYTATCTDAEGDQLWYQFDWGDQHISEWLGPYNSGDPCTAPHTYAEVGVYEIKVQVKDLWDSQSDWSPALTVTPACCVERGNVDGEGGVNVSDLTYIVAHLFSGGPGPACDAEGDIDASGDINVSDLTFLVSFLFQGGDTPPACF